VASRPSHAEPAGPTRGQGELLERSDLLAELDGYLDAAQRDAQGRLILIGGEAGVGKTSLLQEFCDRKRGAARILWGYCEPLVTPGPLGPFFDVAQAVGGEFEEAVSSEARPHAIAAALVRELAGQRPGVVVIEDVHWGDEATLDVLRLVGRRLAGVRALVVASYRDDELDRLHPLTLALGDLATVPGVRRIRIPPLSKDAVRELAARGEVDPDELFRQTGGNPFFVTEVLAAGTLSIPATVRDAVLARAARLSPPARRLLEAIAVVAPHAEIPLLEALAAGELGQLEECLASGMVAAAEGRVSFRHELARLAVEGALPPDRRVTLHRLAAEALSATEDGVDAARIAHHADAAGDAELVRRFAPAAAAQAAAGGAHREAAAQYARALRFSAHLGPGPEAELLERQAYEAYLTGAFEPAIDAQERALERRRALGDPLAEGDCLRSLSRLYRFLGETGKAAALGHEAIERLERLPPGRELALAYVNLGHLYAVAEDAERAIEWSSKALVLADELGDREIRVYALTNYGATKVFVDSSGVPAELTEALRLALDQDLEEDAGRAYLQLVWWPVRRRRYALVDRFLDEGLDYCTERGLDLWRLFFLACRARRELDRGRWDEALEVASFVVGDERVWPVPKVFALSVLALIRGRRGDSGAWPLLDEAWALAKPSGELQRIAPAAAARAELAFLEGASAAVIERDSQAAVELARRRRAAWDLGELAIWRRRAGIVEEIDGPIAEPYAAELAGEHKRAAALWHRLGCPYEEAVALVGSDDDDALRRAHAGLQELDAAAAAAVAARRLRERGVKGIPRGPRRATTANPKGLTAREVEVLELVTEGLRNAEIAERLFLSEKTVGHHVSAILRKLEVRNRSEAGSEARRLGIVGT
jgi:DNA-binding CsgD family transcriptional regulator